MLTATRLMSSATALSNALLTVNANGTFSYDPNGQFENLAAGAMATDGFTYQICDPTPACATATVTITINGINDPPVLTLPGPAAQFDFVTPVLIDPTATVTDIDSAVFDTGTVTAQVTEASCDGLDLLAVNNQGVGADQISVVGNDIFFGATPDQIGTITSDFLCDPNPPGAGNTLLTIALNTNATPAAVQILVQNLTFSTSSAVVTDRAIEIAVDDGDGGSSTPQTQTILLDAAPEVSATTPPDQASDIAINSTISITFSENVTVNGNWVQVGCPSGTQNIDGSGGAVGTLGVTNANPTYTLNPSVDFANGETCTLTVFAAQVSDDDTIDPPDTMAADFTASFTTVDVAPEVTSTTPTEAATVATDQAVTLNFSEDVDVTTASITFNCGAAIAFTPGSTSDINTLTLTPDSALPEGAACTVTVPAAAVSDVDTVDPPDELAAPFTLTFNTDTAPDFVSSTPADSTTGVLLDSTIQITFTEPVDVVVADFGLDCGTGTPGFNISGSGTATITLTPTANLPQGAMCTVTLTSGINDSDSVDPPDDYSGNVPSFGFTTVDLAPTVTNTQVEVAGVLTNTPTINVDANTSVVIAFSEEVDADLGASSSTAPPAVMSAPSSAPVPPPANTATLTNGGVDLFPGETCTLTVVATNISDNDGVPPANMAVNFIYHVHHRHRAANHGGQRRY
ncbi:MAG: Ig-like domain-containing protein [Candidatus Competibacteraceae bacterium]